MKENQEEKELTPWENWIANSQSAKSRVDSAKLIFDKLCDLAVQNYNLDTKSRKSEFKDEMHFFIEWWDKNRLKSAKYRKNSDVDRLLKKKHGVVYHYLNRRAKTLDYDINTECIKDFLES